MEGIQMDLQDKDLPKQSLGNDGGLAELPSEETVKARAEWYEVTCYMQSTQ